MVAFFLLVDIFRGATNLKDKKTTISDIRVSLFKVSQQGT